MKNSNLKSLGLLGLMGLAISFNSCQKVEKYSSIDLLADKTWSLLSIQQNGEEISQSCDLDDKMTLQKDAKYILERGPLYCEEWENEDSEEAFNSLKWKFKDDYATLVLISQSKRGNIITARGNEFWDILELTENKLVIKEQYPATNEVKPIIKTFIN